MPETISMIPNSYKESAFLGKEARNANYTKKIDVTAEKVNQILNPIDDIEKRKVMGESIKLIRGLGIQVDNVGSLNETLLDVNKSGTQKENAEEVLDVLAKGAYIAMRYGKNEGAREDLCSGSVEKIENRLPEPLKGLGERIRSNIIDEPKVIKILDNLDLQRKRFEKAGEAGKTQLRKAIENTIGILGPLEVDSTKGDQIEMVMAFLGAEADKDLNVKSVDVDSTKKTTEKAGESITDIINKKLEKHPLEFDESELPSENDTEEEKERKLRKRELKIEKRGEGVAKVLKQFDLRDRSERSELEIMGPVSIDEIRHTLKEMEDSGRDVSDLTLNSRKFGRLIDITNDINDKIKAIEEGDAEKIEKSIVILGKNGNVLNKDEMLELRTEIKMRSFLNDLFLATSDAHDIESIAKTMVAFHKGDTDKEWDKMFVGFFLKSIEKKDGDGKSKELGSANGLFVDVAWDMRQEAYFNYGGYNSNGDVESGLLNEIAKREDFMREYARMKGWGFDTVDDKDKAKAKADFLNVSLLMSKNEKYRIDKNYYTNLRNDLNLKRREIVKKYMVEEIVKKVEVRNPDLRGVYTKDEAERAYELARKLSVATYTDSAANVAFADGDDYAELILFKFLRYQDGVETDGKKPAKNKPVGSIETIKYINSLTPPWLATLTDKKPGRGMWRPLKAADINAENINPKSESTYHFGSIILKKAQEAKMALMTSLTPKDALDPDKLQKTYERLSKVVAEADKAGWDILDDSFFPMPKVDGVHIKDRSISHLLKAQKYFRAIYVIGVLERATQSSAYGWTKTAYDEFVRLMMKSTLFTSQSGEQNETFISKDQLDWINKAYHPKQIFQSFENIEKGRKRNLFR